MKRYLLKPYTPELFLVFYCCCFLTYSHVEPWTISLIGLLLVAGRYLVSWDHCNRDGKRRTSTRWSPPNESSFYHPSWKSSSGGLSFFSFMMSHFLFSTWSKKKILFKRKTPVLTYGHFFFIVQLDEHFSRYMKEFVSLCLKKVPAEVRTCTLQLR